MEDSCVAHTDAADCTTDVNNSCRWLKKKGWFTSSGVCHSQVACSLNLTTADGALAVDELYNSLRQARDKSTRQGLKMSFNNMKQYAFLSKMRICLRSAKKETEKLSASIGQRNSEMEYYQKILDDHLSGKQFISDDEYDDCRRQIKKLLNENKKT